MARRVVVPFMFPQLRNRYSYNANARWARKPVKTGAGYRWPCFVCGEEGVLGIDIVAWPIGLLRIRSLTHRACWDGLPVEVRSRRLMEDELYVIRRYERRERREENTRQQGKKIRGY